MQEKKRFIFLIIFDSLTFVLAMVGFFFSLFDVRFMADYPRLSTLPIWMTFTGLSNLFIGLVSIGCMITRTKRKETTLPKVMFMLKLIALVAISITMLVTACVLAPAQGASWWRLYINNNLFNHLLTPLLAIFTFLVFEQYVETSLFDCLFSLLPIIAYSVFYVINVCTHLNEHGKVNPTYDIYGLLRYGIGIAFLFFLAFTISSFGLAALYRFLNKKKTASLRSSY